MTPKHPPGPPMTLGNKRLAPPDTKALSNPRQVLDVHRAR